MEVYRRGGGGGGGGGGGASCASASTAARAMRTHSQRQRRQQHTQRGEEREEEALRTERKLLVLDLNGLLVHRTKRKRPMEEKEWTSNLRGFLTSSNNVYTRPYVSSFLEYCFTWFDVGVWTSCREENMSPILDKLLTGAQRESLIFAWHNEHCGYDTEAQYRRLKNLQTLWRNIPIYDVRERICVCACSHVPTEVCDAYTAGVCVCVSECDTTVY